MGDRGEQETDLKETDRHRKWRGEEGKERRGKKEKRSGGRKFLQADRSLEIMNTGAKIDANPM